MSTKRMLLTILAAGAVLAAVGIGPQFIGSARALPPTQAGVTIPYSGHLSNEAGVPVADGAYDFAFALYAAQTGGEPLWTETQEGVAVQGGAFTVLLGRVAPLPQEVLGGGARWLEVGVRGPGEAAYTRLAPRQELSVAASAAQAGAVAPAGGGLSCAHTHWGETWSGSGNGLVLLGNSDNSITLSAGDQSPHGGYGVFGLSEKGIGVAGRSDSSAGYGMYGLATATSGTNFGVYGESRSPSGYGVYGKVSASGGLNYGVYGESPRFGVYGKATSTTMDNSGVYGESYSINGDGVSGIAFATSGSTCGVVGHSYSPDGYGVLGAAHAASGTNYGVYGESYSINGYGVAGVALATSGTNYGVYGGSNSTNGYGVYGLNIYGGYAGYFYGKVHVQGTLSKSAGGFRIDHPLDPANKYLNHSFVESPDMKNVYDGVVLLDANGEAWVQLPEWFEALNQDFRYQLTPIGAPMPNLYIAQKIQGNRFKIAGGVPGKEVSWQVTGIRHDPFAERNRIPVEEDKPADERGTYLYPEGYGQPQEKGLDYRRHPELFREPPEAPAPQGNE